ncbi:RteC domain-containing protein [Solitalea lacus]|uniref:RteC domain-containing protein n=1 Tax=Solitalea lacus TaxID=2911172 RepID=UPI001EDBB475|nr:RteC domain-containing protein [Solitalea lacus]UKJ09218.1 RteC domain-containing protein [Solitalea lacus]
MNHFKTNLYVRMNERLQLCAIESENILQRAEKSFYIAESALQELKDFLFNYRFKTTSEEIEFFKEIKPLFLRELIYFIEVFHLEASKPFGGKEGQRNYYLQELDRLRLFFDRNNFLYTYYRTNKSHMDELFYLRNKSCIPMLPEYLLDMDPNFSTIYSSKLAKLQAFEQLKEYVNQSLMALDEIELQPVKSKEVSSTWTDSKASLIELAYALQSSGCVNFGKADVKHIITNLERMFNIQLGNFYRVYQGMRIRKKNRTVFLDVLKERLEKRMDDADMSFY